MSDETRRAEPDFSELDALETAASDIATLDQAGAAQWAELLMELQLAGWMLAPTAAVLSVEEAPAVLLALRVAAEMDTEGSDVMRAVADRLETYAKGDGQ